MLLNQSDLSYFFLFLQLWLKIKKADDQKQLKKELVVFLVLSKICDIRWGRARFRDYMVLCSARLWPYMKLKSMMVRVCEVITKTKDFHKFIFK